MKEVRENVGVIGIVITLFIALGGFVSNWYGLGTNLELLKQDVAVIRTETEKANKTLRESVKDHEDRIRMLERKVRL